MTRTRFVNDLSVEELRLLIIQKRRAERQARLDHYQRTGRVIRLEPQPLAPTLDRLSSIPLSADGLEMEDAEALVAAPRQRASWMNRALFLVEIAAVIGLILIVFTSFNALRNINAESAALMIQPTLTPTPLVMAVVLPSGHTAPIGSAPSEPNNDEIPAHLQPLVQSLANLPIPTPGPQQALRIQIPAIKVDAPVVQGDGWEQLRKGVGQHIGSPDPGQQGNLVLSAHNDIFGEIFKDLDLLQPGDEVIVYTSQHAYVYVVQQTQVVEPTRVEVMGPTNEPVVTLISCYPYKVDNQRIVVSAVFSEQR